jgi:hypothetical protein
MSKNHDNLSPSLQHVLSKLKKVKYIGSSRHMAECPCHDDREASLSISTGDDGRVLLKCFAGCTAEEIVKSLGLNMKDLFPERGRGHKSSGKKAARLHTPKGKSVSIKESPCKADCTPPAHPLHTGCTLQEYADAKKLPVDFLRSLGLSDITYLDRPAVRMPYYDTSGNESGAVRIRKQLEKTDDGDNRFAWKKGSKLCLYGLNRKYRETYRIAGEGESDCQTLWYNGLAAVGVPGADNWKEERDASYFDDIETIYVVIEPDHGGEAVKKWLSKSRIRTRARLISLGEYKDPSGLYLSDPEHFKERFKEAMNQAIPWTDLEASEGAKVKEEAWAHCSALAENGDILDRFVRDLSRLGLVGEERISKILYLCMVSRFLSRIVSAVLKGPSSGGKSFLVDCILKFFPASAFYALTSMSEQSLAYSDEPLKKRFLVLFEAAGLNSDLASYMLRSLLSEGRVRYETVEKTKEGLKPRLIEREGPTGAIITTTSVRLHPENETRLLSMTVSDTQEQTARVMLALAEELPDNKVDFTLWHSLQMWLEHSEHRVVIPCASDLAKEIPPLAVRLRRDFTTVLNLIRAHAILNQARREKAEDGAIIAALEDYAIVRDLVLDFISEGIGVAVPESIRDTVEAIERVIQGGSAYATIAQVAQRLNLDRSATTRRVNAAIAKGYLVNTENKEGSAKKIAIGDPLPEDVELLPFPEKLGVCRCAGVQVCRCAGGG